MNLRPPQFATVLLCAIFGAPISALPRATDDAATPAFANVPFDSWLAGAPQDQIPWKINVTSRGLSVFERLLANIEVEVPGTELLKRREHGQLIVLLELRDSTGHSFKSHAAIDLASVNDSARKNAVDCAFDALVLPGDYRASIVLYDAETKEHSVAARPLHVDSLKKDPLEGSWRDFPSVEFLPNANSKDAWFLPEAAGHFHLPIESRRPVEIQLLMNLAASQAPPHFHPSEATEPHSHSRLEALLPAFKMLSEISVTGGSLDATALDLTHHRVAFEQGTPPALDWSKLKDAFATADPNVIDVKALQSRKDNAAFFRDEVARRIAAPSNVSAANAGATPPSSATRVFIILSPPLEFDSGTDLHAIEKEDCACRIFYIRYHLSHGEELRDDSQDDHHMRGGPGGHYGHHGDWGQLSPANHPDFLEGVLKPLHPRVVDAHTPMDLRKAVASILHDISEL